MSTDPVRRRIKGLPQDQFAADGLMYQDWYAITSYQRACTARLGKKIQLEQEGYINQHPEILAMLKVFIAKMAQQGKIICIDREAALNFTRPVEELDKEIRTYLQLPEDGPYVKMEDKMLKMFEDNDYQKDLRDISKEFYPPPHWDIHTPAVSSLDTLSSSFISIITSASTLPTPEPIPTPEQTLSEMFYTVISNTVDKVIFSKVDERDMLYDIAYVELMNAVEEAMEIPVQEIKVDIQQLFHDAYSMFEVIIKEKERIAAEIEWEKRMRKKLKRTLRRQKNFRGYETPPTPRSHVSSHESYKGTPPRHCECQPLAHYNRYGKDRFGIYLPRKESFSTKNITTTPPVPTVKINEGKKEEADKKVIKTSAVNVSQDQPQEINDDQKQEEEQVEAVVD